jgi:hypothetical protein
VCLQEIDFNKEYLKNRAKECFRTSDNSSLDLGYLSGVCCVSEISQNRMVGYQIGP